VEHERIKEDGNRSRSDVDLANEESTTGTDLEEREILHVQEDSGKYNHRQMPA